MLSSEGSSDREDEADEKEAEEAIEIPRDAITPPSAEPQRSERPNKLFGGSAWSAQTATAQRNSRHPGRFWGSSAGCAGLEPAMRTESATPPSVRSRGDD